MCVTNINVPASDKLLEQGTTKSFTSCAPILYDALQNYFTLKGIFMIDGDLFENNDDYKFVTKMIGRSEPSFQYIA